MPEFTATFWGVRGGYPVPGQGTLEFGGNTTCLQVQAGPHLIIVDAGTGIIGLGDKLMAQRAQDRQPITGTLLFTHGHHDHTQGLAHFAPLYLRDSVFHALGPQVPGEDLASVLKRAMHPPIDPDSQTIPSSVRSIRHVSANHAILVTRPGSPPVIVDLDQPVPYLPPWAVWIRIYHSPNHPKGGTLCYRLEYRGKQMAFATDIEGYEGGDTLVSQFVRGADLLIHDAEYTDQEYAEKPFSHQGWGHSTWRMAVQVAREAGVKRLALTHHHADHDDPLLRDIEGAVQAVFPGAFVAREGMTVSL
jgi:phosphoribosyl 1,2-cyclic phosphodiesterase